MSYFNHTGTLCRWRSVILTYELNGIKMVTSGSLLAMAKRAKSRDRDRLTISLARGQREALEIVAGANNATLAFIIRCAISEFIDTHRDGQLKLSFPRLPSIEDVQRGK